MHPFETSCIAAVTNLFLKLTAAFCFDALTLTLCTLATAFLTTPAESYVCGIGKDNVCIDPTNLFHRLAERTSNLHECFSYELTPYPMSLFKDGQMRKPDKASLYHDFRSIDQLVLFTHLQLDSRID